MSHVNIIVTEHAYERLRERSGINKKAAVRLSERAYFNGLKHGETKGNLFKFLSGIAYKSNKGCDLRIYGDKVFIFNKKETDIVLVTVMQLPNNLCKNVNILMEKKNLNKI